MSTFLALEKLAAAVAEHKETEGEWTASSPDSETGKKVVAAMKAARAEEATWLNLSMATNLSSVEVRSLLGE